MKLYLAGIYTGSFEIGGRLYARLTDNEKRQRDAVQHYLESYHYIHRQSMVDKIRASGVKVFLDSGAFSAYTQGVDVDIDGYCDYIKRNADIIEVASVLDGIGDPLKTWENQRYMEAQGVRPLPCFHYGEDEKYLDWYIANYEYITLGGMVPISTPQLYLWLDRIWEKHLTDGAGRPLLKVHGFGLTTAGLVERYPWYSVDSSTWVQAARNGNVFHPRLGKVVAVSDRSPARKTEGAHVDNMSAAERALLLKELEGYGADIERLQTNYLARWAFNAWSFNEIAKRSDYTTATFKPEQMGLF